MFEKSWKYGKDLFAWFIDLEKVSYDCFSNFGGFCRRMALMVSCYLPLRHSVVPAGVSRLSKWQAIKAFHIDVELWQGCVLYLLFSIVYMNCIPSFLSRPIVTYLYFRSFEILAFLCFGDFLKVYRKFVCNLLQLLV